MLAKEFCRADLGKSSGNRRRGSKRSANSILSSFDLRYPSPVSTARPFLAGGRLIAAPHAAVPEIGDIGWLLSPGGLAGEVVELETVGADARDAKTTADAGQRIGEAELAQRWKVSKRTIQRWRQEGRLPEEFRIGRKVLFSAEVILAFENASQCKAEGR